MNRVEESTVGLRSPHAATRIVRAALVGTVILFSLSACGLDISTDRPGPPMPAKYQQALETGRLRFDLTQPPTRAEADMAAGRASICYPATEEKPLHLELSLPTGMEFIEEKASQVCFVTAGGNEFDAAFGIPASPSERNAPPARLSIHHEASTLEGVRDYVLAKAQQFGFDATPIWAWHEAARIYIPGKIFMPMTDFRFLADVGYLHLDISPTYSPPQEHFRELAYVSLTFKWSPNPSPQSP